MTDPAPNIRKIAAAPPAGHPVARPSLASVLLERGALFPANHARAVGIAEQLGIPLDQVLRARGWVTEADLIAAQSQRFNAPLADLEKTPPDPALIEALGPDVCIAHSVVPLRRLAGGTVLVTSEPEAFHSTCKALPADLSPYLMALAPRPAVLSSLEAALREKLVTLAETRAPAADSVRTLWSGHLPYGLGAGLGLVAAVAVMAPAALLLSLYGLAVATLLAVTLLKLAAALATLSRPSPKQPDAKAPTGPLPVVTLLIALYREEGVVRKLIEHLLLLDYPPELLDVILLVEDDDPATANAILNADLPPWMRLLTVPGGTIRTKPRALNYGLSFARGSIIGVYDAEDLPDPAQLKTVVRHFATASPETACIQGTLDYFAARRNWLTRCFAIDYAVWFRVVLPGLARLGLVVPLGGTTVFFRRAALETVGAWDAHNVTEDADLGLRLARRGYRTDVIESVTKEEPNARVLPWIRQRSRWQKGYALTWAVAMRHPLRLLRELGPWRFLGVQVQFAGSLAQAALAPLLWSLWAFAFGLDQVAGLASSGLFPALALLFVLATCINGAVALYALRRPEHRHLMPWIVAMAAYSPLATVSLVRALTEAVRRPFHWDKTKHGIVSDPAEAAELPIAVPRPVAVATPHVTLDRPVSERERQVLAAIAARVKSDAIPGQVVAARPSMAGSAQGSAG